MRGVQEQSFVSFSRHTPVEVLVGAVIGVVAGSSSDGASP